MDHESRAVVVGGGWSGIAAAWYLRQAGYAVSVLDEAAQPGGRSATAWLGSRPLCLGGKNIGTRYRLFREFAAELGVTDFEHFGINSSRIENGRVRTVDGTARISSVLGYLLRTPLPDTMQFLRLVRKVRDDERNRFLDGPGFASLRDIPLDRVFGPYLREQLIRPVTVRMNGAEPGEMYLRNFGANLGMLLDSFDQLTGGFEPVFARIGECVDWRAQHRVRRLLTAGGAVTGVEASGPGGRPVTVDAGVVVIAVPAPAAAGLVAEFHGDLAGQLAAIPYFPAAVAVVRYDQNVFTEQVRGLVFPPDSPLSNAGAYGVHDLSLIRYTFSGAAARPVLDRGDADLVALAEDRLRPYLPVSGRGELVMARWPAAFCAYGAEHPERLRRISGLVAGIPGLGLAGDYIQGASIEACFRSADDCVQALATRSRGLGSRL